MVRVRVSGFAAVNVDAANNQGHAAAATETIEAQEARVARAYEKALLLILKGQHEEGQQELRLLLEEPVLQAEAAAGPRDATSGGLSQLRFLVLKNLAEATGPYDGTEALRLYLEAAQLRPEDVSLWSQVAILAQGEGRLDLARSALEAGLHLSPRHRLMQDRLLEVLLATGDLEAAADLAAASLATCPGNKRMRQVLHAHGRLKSCGSMEEAQRLHEVLQPLRFARNSSRKRPCPHDAEEEEDKPGGTGPVYFPEATWGCLLKHLNKHLLEQKVPGAVLDLRLGTAPGKDDSDNDKQQQQPLEELAPAAAEEEGEAPKDPPPQGAQAAAKQREEKDTEAKTAVPGDKETCGALTGEAGGSPAAEAGSKPPGADNARSGTGAADEEGMAPDAEKGPEEGQRGAGGADAAAAAAATTAAAAAAGSGEAGAGDGKVILSQANAEPQALLSQQEGGGEGQDEKEGAGANNKRRRGRAKRGGLPAEEPERKSSRRDRAASAATGAKVEDEEQEGMGLRDLIREHLGCLEETLMLTGGDKAVTAGPQDASSGSRGDAEDAEGRRQESPDEANKQEAAAVKAFLDHVGSCGWTPTQFAAALLSHLADLSSGAISEGSQESGALNCMDTGLMLKLANRAALNSRGLSAMELLFLAECRLSEVQKAKDSQASAQSSRPPEPREAKRGPGRPPSQKKRRTAEGPADGAEATEDDAEPSETAEEHKRAAGDLLARMHLAVLREHGFRAFALPEGLGDAIDEGGETEKPCDGVLEARFYWLLGSLAEAGDDHEEARRHFQICAERCKAAGIRLRLRHLQGAAEVSAAGVAAHLELSLLRHKLVSAPERLRDGAAAEVVADLADELLSDPSEPPLPAAKLLGDNLRLEALELLSGAAVKAMDEDPLPQVIPAALSDGAGGETGPPAGAADGVTAPGAATEAQQREREGPCGGGPEGVGSAGGGVVRGPEQPAKEKKHPPIAASKALGIHLRSLLRLLDELLPKDVARADPGPKQLLVVDSRVLRALSQIEPLGQRLQDPNLQGVIGSLPPEWTAAMRRCQTRLATLVEVASARASDLFPGGPTGASLSATGRAARRTLFELAMAFCGLIEMDAALSEDPKATEQLLQALFQELVKSGAVGLDKFRFLNHVMRRLGSAMDRRQLQLERSALEKPPSAEEDGGGGGSSSSDDEEDEDEEDTLMVELRGAVLQCLYAMFGIDLPQRNSSWGDRAGKLTPGTSGASGAAAASGAASSQAALSKEEAPVSRENWLEVWKCLGSVLRQPGKKKKKKHTKGSKDIIERIVQAFPTPPDGVSSVFETLWTTFLDARDLEVPGWESSRPTILDHTPPTEGINPVEVDMYRHIYYQCSNQASDLDLEQTEMLKEAGWEEVTGREQVIRNDLALNPSRFASWEKLGELYTEALSSLQADAAQWIAVGAWDPDGVHSQRMALLQRRARRAWVAARFASATENDVGFMQDSLGLAHYFQTQAVPPMADQRGRRPEKDGTWRASLRIAAESFRCAKAIMPEEWSFSYYIGKVKAKFGEPPEDYLHLMAEGCYLACLHNDGLLEPLYRLHASRLKLLIQQQQQQQQSCAVDGGGSERAELPWMAAAQHCFLPATSTTVKDKKDTKDAADSANDDLWRLLIEDCVAAMSWIVDKDKNYHKAVYRQATAEVAMGNTAAAIELLSNVFTKRGRFGINMWCISSNSNTPAQGAGIAKRQRKRQLVDKDAPEEEWGRARRPFKEPGFEEPAAKNMAAMRKYLLFYTELLQKAGELEHMEKLDQMQRFLLTDATFQTSMEDLGTIALGHYLNMLAAKVKELLPAELVTAVVAARGSVSNLLAPAGKKTPAKTPVSKTAGHAANKTPSGAQRNEESPAGGDRMTKAEAAEDQANDGRAAALAAQGAAPEPTPSSPALMATPGAPQEPRGDQVSRTPGRPDGPGMTAPPTPEHEAAPCDGCSKPNEGSSSSLHEALLAPLSAEAAEVLERCHRLVSELIVAHGGDKAAVEQRISAAMGMAGGEAVAWSAWRVAPEGGEGSSAAAKVSPGSSSHALECLVPLSEAHLLHSGLCALPEDGRKALDLALAALKKRFRSARVAPKVIRHLFAAISTATTKVLSRQVDSLVESIAEAQTAATAAAAAEGSDDAKKNEKQGDEPGPAAAAAAVAQEKPSRSTRGSPEEPPHIQALLRLLSGTQGAQQLLRRCHQHYKSPPGGSVSSSNGIRTPAELLLHSFSAFRQAERAASEAGVPGGATEGPSWLKPIIADCEEMLPRPAAANVVADEAVDMDKDAPENNDGSAEAVAEGGVLPAEAGLLTGGAATATVDNKDGEMQSEGRQDPGAAVDADEHNQAAATVEQDEAGAQEDQNQADGRGKDTEEPKTAALTWI